jgi:hypothetical protein
MKATVGLILVLVGGGVIVFGIGTAMMALFGLYGNAIDNAMGMGATAEQDASRAMIRGVIVGACGVPFLIAGSVLLKVTMFQRMARGRGAGKRQT